MRVLFCSFLMFFILFSCAHKEKSTQDNHERSYSPVISFKEEGKLFEGKITFPKDFKAPLPLVIVAHEWWGKTEYIKGRARMLAEEGVAALPVDLFGNGVTVETPKEAQKLATPLYKNPQLGIERLKKYIEIAKKDPHIDPYRIYVIGYCFGGTMALNLARSDVEVEGVVSFHGGLTSSIKTPEKIPARILILHGGADPMVPSSEVISFEKEMKKASANYRIVTYPGATHAFTNPKATELGKRYNIPIAYDERADRASWKELIKFLK